MTDGLNIVVIAPARHPIRQPHAGGLESAVWNEVRMLRRRGHRVRLIAVEGSDFLAEGPQEFVLPQATWHPTEVENDTDYPRGHLDRAGAALARALDQVAAEGDRIDVVANHSLHPLPLLRAGELGAQMLTTLHTPVLPELVDANDACVGTPSRFVSVSEHTRAVWAEAGVSSTVVPNGIDTADWPLGDGSAGGLVWSGRLVPEKAPHLAIEVARAVGVPLTIVGRIGDPTYARRHVLPRLGADIRYEGVLPQPELAALVGRSAVALATPVWPEPFGLVVPEALLCGTPVAAFGIGGIEEIARSTTGVRTAPVGDVEALAEVVRRILATREPGDRARTRAAAAQAYSLDRRTDRFEALVRRSSVRLTAA